MQYYSFQQQNVPALGLGTWDLRGEVATKMAKYALSVGYRHIDTAQFYNNEAELGKGIKESEVPRDQVFLTTKIWPTFHRKEAFAQAFDECLGRLQVSEVDLLLIHWPSKEVPLAETVEALMRAKEVGKTKLIGVSNFTTAMIRETLEMGADIFANQVEYHPFLDQSVLKGLMDAHGIHLTAYSPIARGNVIGDPVIRPIAERHGKNEVQVTLRWLLDQERVLAIPRSAKEKNVASNLEIFDFELSPEETAAINQLRTSEGRLVNSPFSPAWD